MRRISRQQARELDLRASERFRIPSVCLMENAGGGAARLLLDRWGVAPGAEVVCVCGPGQNGGDGLVVARHLLVARCRPRVLVLPPPGRSRLPGDAGRNLRICRALGLDLAFVRDATTDRAIDAAFEGAAVVVDGLFGTGLRRPLDGAAARIVGAVARARLPVLALDLPSGMDADTGRPLGPCVRADVTATFAAPKLGFARRSSRAWTGEVVVVPIGTPL